MYMTDYRTKTTISTGPCIHHSIKPGHTKQIMLPIYARESYNSVRNYVILNVQNNKLIAVKEVILLLKTL